jgi:aminopeptidase N
MHRIGPALLCLWFGLQSPLMSEEVQPGIARDLAHRRAAQLRAVEYDLSFMVPPERAAPVSGAIEIRFTLTTPDEPVVLDFRQPAGSITEFKVAGQVVTPEIRNGHLLIPVELLVAGTNRVSISFRAGDAPLNRHADFLYSLFVPARASECFPCFDQPDLKARFALSLQIPRDWTAVSNGPEVKRIEREENVIVDFERTSPISSYLFAFAAGEFQVEEIEGASRRIRIYHRETDRAKVERNLDEIMSLHQHALDWLEEYTGIDHPFPKLDFVLIPSFQYGGMEHAGCIFYRDQLVLLDESPTRDERLRRASIISHETAHMWFGNLVTMTWFNDVWLKEVFANFYAAKMVNPVFPEFDHDLRFLIAHYPGAYRIDRTAGANPILQELDNLLDAGSLYGGIIYRKSPIVMRRLEERMGEEAFRAGIRDYLKEYAWGNATWNDLVDELEPHAGGDLRPFLDPLVHDTGMPELEADTDPFAYGYVPLTPRNREEVLSRRIHDPKPLVRGAAWITLWENMVRHTVAPDQMMAALQDRIPREEDPILVGYLLELFRTVFWRWQSHDERLARVASIESMFWDQSDSRDDPAAKRAFYDALVSVMLTPETVDRLTSAWESKQGPDGLPLSESDLSTLSFALTLRGRDVTEAQRARFENPDRKARFEFVLPAVNADASMRAQFNTSLADAQNRVREPWVLEALRTLHHPLRAESSVTYLPGHLQLLEEVKATGDIFFPQGWLDAAFSGHRSPEAAAAIRAFLDSHPDLPADLRAKILQSADPVFRAAYRPK